MSILDLYDSAFRKRNKDHFAAIVRVAMSDGVIVDEEKKFIDKLATRLDITDSEYNEILKNYTNYPINPPITYDHRLERLYDLARMVYADEHLGEKQKPLLEKLAVGLGFSSKNVQYIVDKALKLVNNNEDIDTFTEEMKNMNQ